VALDDLRQLVAEGLKILGAALQADKNEVTV
jgi:hypothetical protein